MTGPVPSPRDHDAALAGIGRAFSDSAEVSRVQSRYLRWFTGRRRVLDVGCGDGGFLELLRKAGHQAVGLDADLAVVRRLRDRGHEVSAGDARCELRELADPFDAVFLAHVIEHFTPAEAVALLSDVASVLTPGGRVVIVTPNVANLIVLSEVFWLDPTHVRPYPRALIERLGREVGFDVVASFDDPATTPRRRWLPRAVAWLRSKLSGADRSGPMDSVVVLERAAS